MLVTNVPKPRKNVLVVSTMHNTPDVYNVTMKPEVIQFNNASKGDVDVIDQMINTYRRKVATRRWPMVVFYTMIDIALVNAMVTLRKNNPNWFTTPKRKSRRSFLEELGNTMITPQILHRHENQQGLQKYVITAMETFLGRTLIPVATPRQAANNAPATLGRCFISIQNCKGSDYKKKKISLNKIKQTCSSCDQKVCTKHCITQIVCNECVLFE